MVNYEYYAVPNSEFTLVCFHGFMGHRVEWYNLHPLFRRKLSLFIVDLPGHGDSPLGEDVPSMDGVCDYIHGILSKNIEKKLVLLGYSMGGRLAIEYALKYPRDYYAMILESTRPGCDPEEQAAFQTRHDDWMRSFQSLSHEEALTKWYNQSLFSLTKTRLHADELSFKKSPR